MSKIYVNCGGSLDVYNSKQEALDFFEECILMSEGSERERYTVIYFSIKGNLNSNKRCFTDGTDHIYTSNIDPDNIDSQDEKLLKCNYEIDKNKLLRLKFMNNSDGPFITAQRKKDSDGPFITTQRKKDSDITL
ncbi:MAG: hypothetical protein Q4G05_01590 [Clostridia bacterium]|nr:hypothetical protein [Clostridia bacterium]